MFLPEATMNVKDIALTGLRWILVEGTLDKVICNMEEDMIDYSRNHTWISVAYDRSFEESGYNRTIVSERVVGFRILKYI